MSGRVALMSAALALAAIASASPEPDVAAFRVQRYDPPTPAPAFALPDLGERTVRLQDQRGKVVLLFFWATW